jgi:hypothetical protein
MVAEVTRIRCEHFGGAAGPTADLSTRSLVDVTATICSLLDRDPRPAGTRR